MEDKILSVRVFFIQCVVGGAVISFTLEGQNVPNINADVYQETNGYKDATFTCLNDYGFNPAITNSIIFEVNTCSQYLTILLMETLRSDKTSFNFWIPGPPNSESRISEWDHEYGPQSSSILNGSLLNCHSSLRYNITWNAEDVSIKICDSLGLRIFLDIYPSVYPNVRYICVASDKNATWTVDDREESICGEQIATQRTESDPKTTTSKLTAANTPTDNTATKPRKENDPTETTSAYTADNIPVTTDNTPKERQTITDMQKKDLPENSSTLNVPVTTENIADEELKINVLDNDDQTTAAMLTEGQSMNVLSTTSNLHGTDSGKNSSTEKTDICSSYVCRCAANISIQQLDEEIKQLREALTVNKKDTTLHLNKLRSADDKRMSAAGIGYVGVAIIAGGLVGIVLLDLPNLAHMFTRMYRNITQ